MQCQTQAGNITTNIKVELYFTLHALSSMNLVMWECHLYHSYNGRYDMFLGRYILT